MSGPLYYLTTPFDISADKPRVISPPLKGSNWVALNGCCEPGFPHRDAVLPANGQIGNSQTLAIDWKRANDEGAFYTGDRTKNESYVDYGQPVFAVADGTVVGILDNVDANAPGIQPSQVPAEAARLKIENADGNHVVLDLGGGVWAIRLPLPGYPVGMVLLARLAVHRGEQGKGLGGLLLTEALRKAVVAGGAAAARLVVVDAIDEDAANFYARRGFTPAPEHPLRLYRRMAEVRASVNRSEHG